MSFAEVLSGDRPWWIETADVVEGLKMLPDDSVSCVVTSPPYWQLRDYGTATWSGGDPACDHRKVQDGVKAVATSTLGGGKKTTGHQQEGYPDRCARCGAERVDRQLGLEPTPEAFVARLVEVFREVRRVLHPTGVVFLNIGDSYFTRSARRGGGNREQIRLMEGDAESPDWKDYAAAGAVRYSSGHPTLKDKDLCLIPERLAIALQDDGWWVRSRITWAKTACMPENAPDRPTSSSEPIWLLAKSRRYYWDHEGYREESVSDHGSGNGFKREARQSKPYSSGAPRGQDAEWRPNGSRAIRNVWLLGPEPYAEAHFATFVSEIPRRAIALGTSEKGVCPACGAPWKRLKAPTAEYAKLLGRDWADYAQDAAEGRGHSVSGQRPVKRNGPSVSASYVTTGWVPTCGCDAGDPRPAVVLDPFSGAATTGLVALRLGRRYVGVELNPQYVEMARKRIVADQGVEAERAAEVQGTAQLRLPGTAA